MKTNDETFIEAVHEFIELGFEDIKNKKALESNPKHYRSNPREAQLLHATVITLRNVTESILLEKCTRHQISRRMVERIIMPDEEKFALLNKEIVSALNQLSLSQTPENVKLVQKSCRVNARNLLKYAYMYSLEDATFYSLFEKACQIAKEVYSNKIFNGENHFENIVLLYACDNIESHVRHVTKNAPAMQAINGLRDYFKEIASKTQDDVMRIPFQHLKALEINIPDDVCPNVLNPNMIGCCDKAFRRIWETMLRQTVYEFDETDVRLAK